MLVVGPLRANGFFLYNNAPADSFTVYHQVGLDTHRKYVTETASTFEAAQNLAGFSAHPS